MKNENINQEKYKMTTVTTRSQTAKKLYIFTEERPRIDEIEEIVKLYGFKITKKLKLSFNKKDNRLEVTGVHKKAVIVNIVSGNTSFVDYLVYHQVEFPTYKTEPDYAIESTKSSVGDAGNMWYQRLIKFAVFDIFYKNNKTKKIILYNVAKDNSKGKADTNKPWIIGNMLGYTNGIENIVKNASYKGINKKFTSIEHLAEVINSTRNTSGINNRVYIHEDRIELQTKLMKKDSEGKEKLAHDPNKGFAAGVIGAIRKIEKTKPIVIIKHQLPQLSNRELNNKFLYAIKSYGNVSLSGIKIDFDKVNQDKYDRYFKEENGEKVVSIILDIILSNRTKNTWDILFTNHAGCEKGFLMIDNEVITIPKSVQIPDIVLHNKKTKTVYILEAEKAKNYKTGVKQLETFGNFENLLKKEMEKAGKGELTYTKDVILYGKGKEDVLFRFDSKGSFESFWKNLK